MRYDMEAMYFDEGVRNSRRPQLKTRALFCLRSLGIFSVLLRKCLSPHRHRLLQTTKKRKEEEEEEEEETEGNGEEVDARFEQKLNELIIPGCMQKAISSLSITISLSKSLNLAEP
ncbi:hypothetical protein ABKV19_003130 [Rosa sericea]